MPKTPLPPPPPPSIRPLLDAHFVRRQVVGKNLCSDADEELPPSPQRLSGKTLREQLKQAIDALLGASGGPKLDVGRFASLLRRCASARALGEGRRLHDRIAQLGYERDTYLGNNLVAMYGKCGRLRDAIAAFERIESLNIYSLNTMISAYAQNGHMSQARDLFHRMPQWDPISWTAILVASASASDLHGAKRLFDSMPEQDLVAWNAMVTAYARGGHSREALELFQRMDLEGVAPDRVSFLSVIRAFESPEALPGARIVHSALAVDDGARSDVVLATALVDMYGKCGRPSEARAIFREIGEKNVVTWTAMVAAYAHNGQIRDAEAVFLEMPEKNVVSWNAMITAYARNHDLPRAMELFDSMLARDLNSWNIVISAFAQQGSPSTALMLFKAMLVDGFLPDRFSFVAALDACSGIPSIAEGRYIHAAVIDAALDSDAVVATALVNLYAKGGDLAESRAVFDRMEIERDSLVAWNAMMASYSKNGRFAAALELFAEMSLAGVAPDPISFVSVIFACSHGGRHKDGCDFFASMQLDFGINPIRDHYMGLIDLLARAGQLRDAEELIQAMPVEADDVAMRTLLGAYKTHGSSHRAKEQLDQMEFKEHCTLFSITHDEPD